MTDHLLTDYRNVAAILNCFYLKLRFEKPLDFSLGITMKERVEVTNNLERTVKRYKLDKLNDFIAIDKIDLIDFPRLTIEEIQSHITFGNYQLEQCYGYLREHWNSNGDIQMFLSLREYENSRGIVCCKIHSRHRSQAIYNSFVEYNLNEKLTSR